MLLSQPPLAEVIIDDLKIGWHRWPAAGPNGALRIQDLYEFALRFHGTQDLYENGHEAVKFYAEDERPECTAEELLGDVKCGQKAK